MRQRERYLHRGVSELIPALRRRLVMARGPVFALLMAGCAHDWQAASSPAGQAYGARNVLQAMCTNYATLAAYADRSVVVVEEPLSGYKRERYAITRFKRPRQFYFQAYSGPSREALYTDAAAWTEHGLLNALIQGSVVTGITLSDWASQTRGVTNLVSWIVPPLLMARDSFMCRDDVDAQLLPPVTRGDSSTIGVSMTFERHELLLWIDSVTHLIRRWVVHLPTTSGEVIVSGSYTVEHGPVFGTESFGLHRN